MKERLRKEVNSLINAFSARLRLEKRYDKKKFDLLERLIFEDATHKFRFNDDYKMKQSYINYCDHRYMNLKHGYVTRPDDTDRFSVIVDTYRQVKIDVFNCYKEIDSKPMTIHKDFLEILS